ncbi:MAG: ArgE/DapE family deacylase [Candidatus Hermodarchaeota archaeon]
MTADVKERVWNKIDSQKAEIIKLASDLIRIPSENPPGNMSEIAAFVVGYLEQHGLVCEIYEPENGRINIICSLGEKTGKELVLNGHMDVVPAGDSERWDFPPFGGAIENGFLLGRGASDMKGGVAGIMSAMRFLVQEEDIMNGNVSLTLVPDEETMGVFGTGWILDEGLVNPDACIIAEPTDVHLIDIGQKGAYWGKVRIKGVPIHGSLSPYKGDSAILKACKVMNRMFEVTRTEVSQPDDIVDVIESSKHLIEGLIGEEGIGVILSSPTLNVGIIKGGTKVNVVPGACEIEFDIRLPIGFSVEDATKRLSEVLAEFGDDVELEMATGINPNYTAPTTSLVSLTKQNVNQVLGTEPDVFVQWASSDARHFRLRGIDTIHYGPAIIEGIHGLNEKVKVEDIVSAAKVYAGTAIDYLA